MRAEKWEPIDGIDRPCAQISFSYSPVHTATVSMRFDGLASGPPRDLILKFRQVIVLSKELPPRLIIGKGNPLVGPISSTTLMFMNAWTTIATVTPRAWL